MWTPLNLFRPLSRYVVVLSSYGAVKGQKRFSLPLYDPFGFGGDDIPLSNFFSLLAELPQEPILSPIPPPARRVDRVRSATRTCSTPASSTSSTGSPSPASGPPEYKRPHLSLLQLEPDNLFHSESAPVSSSPSTQPPISAPPPMQVSSEVINYSAHLHSLSSLTDYHKLAVSLQRQPWKWATWDLNCLGFCHQVCKASWCSYILCIRRQGNWFYWTNSCSPRRPSFCPHCDSACWHQWCHVQVMHGAALWTWVSSLHSWMPGEEACPVWSHSHYDQELSMF